LNSALKIVAPLSKVLSPVIAMFVKIANLFVRLFGGHVVQDAQFITIDEIATYLEMGREEGSIDHEEGLMIQRTIAMDETLVKEIMIPRVDIIAVEETQTIREVTELINERGIFEGFQSIEKTIDNIVWNMLCKRPVSLL